MESGNSSGVLQAKYKRIIAIVIGGLLISAIGIAIWLFRDGRSTRPSEIESIAILPLRSLDASDAQIGMGITDSLIRKVSQTGLIKIRPMSAIRRYGDSEADALSAARELSVDAVLEGTVQRSAERLRVSVNLLRTSDGASLWTDQFETRASDIFTVQDAISEKVAAALNLRLDPRQMSALKKQSTSSLEAYEYYTKGRAAQEQFNPSIGDMQAVSTAADYFERATESDPDYALAYAALGYTYIWISNFNDTSDPKWVQMGLDALARAEELDPNLAEIHTARFEYYFSLNGGWNISRAAQEARKAKEVDPGSGRYSLATVYDHLGLNETVGLGELKKALDIDPTDVGLQNRYAESLQLYGKLDESNNVNVKYFGKPRPSALILMGRGAEAIPLLEQEVEKNPGSLVSRSYLALAIALAGDQTAAIESVPVIVKDATKNRAYHHVTYNVASIYALSGNAAEAVKWLRETADNGMPNYPLIARDKNLDGIRESAEFKEFIGNVRGVWERYRDEIEKP